MNIEEIFQAVKGQYNMQFDLKAEQIEIVKSVIEKESVIAILPTGFGKTLTYVVPPLILDQVTV